METLLAKLNYLDSPHYKPIGELNEPETAHLFRLAASAGVSGVYLFQTSPPENDQYNTPARPAVYVAEATTPEQARNIHNKLWNLNFAPFVIIKLPNEIRLYTGFDYSEGKKRDDEGKKDDHNDGLLRTVVDFNLIGEALRDFSADSIDSGHIWKSELGEKIDINRRVDKRLLKNLDALSKALETELPSKIAHALIGKYIYLNYLRDREILSDEWLSKQQLKQEEVFSVEATVDSLQKIIDILEERFNGHIFPLDFDKAVKKGLTDKHVSWVTSVFKGGEIRYNTPDGAIQLQLPFKDYNFHYIPVETLSAIYEQFIDNRKQKGAVYTPEYLADYVLAEVESFSPLYENGKILDPACGSGIFLVLAYRRLIEKRIYNQFSSTLEPKELRQLLLNCIYGVEREEDACYITEFSLILTLLHYVDPPHLHSLDNFKFPNLHNTRIFHADFFNKESEFWSQPVEFDWIVGNPPWVSKEDVKKDEQDKFVSEWMKENSSAHPTADNRVAEAFSWLARTKLKENGIIGFLIPATTLFNTNSHKYRSAFFKNNTIHRITNFTNLREILFSNQDVPPACSIIYQAKLPPDDQRIIHYAPFAINQSTQKNREQLWAFFINSNEINVIRQKDVMDGKDIKPWRLSLWGNFADKHTIDRINHNFTSTLKMVAQKNNWVFNQASQLRHRDCGEELIHVAEMLDLPKLDKDKINDSPFRFSIELENMETITSDWCYVRKQGGRKGIDTSWSPHIFITAHAMDVIVYSEQDFVIPGRNIGISASQNPQTAPHLKALATYLNSSLVAYWLFFNVPQWGIYQRSRRITTRKVKSIPVPAFDDEQIQILTLHYDQLVKREKQAVLQITKSVRAQRNKRLIADSSSLNDTSLDKKEKKKVDDQLKEYRQLWQEELDQVIYDTLGIPNDMQTTITDFLNIRLPLDDQSTSRVAIQTPNKHHLEQYGQRLKQELDQFVMGKAIHRIEITISDDLIGCMIESNVPDADIEIGVDVKQALISRQDLLSKLNEQLKEQISQWVYVKHTLRMYDRNQIHLYKSPRLIDWTQTQALIDSQDIISHILTTSKSNHE